MDGEHHQTRQQHYTNLMILLDKDIEKRRLFNVSDFSKAQTFTWVSVLSSAVASIWTALGPEFYYHKAIIAAIAVIPAIVLTIENSFRFRDRARVNGSAVYFLQLLKLRLQRGQDPYKIEIQYIRYMNRLEAGFPGGGGDASFDFCEGEEHIATAERTPE